MGLKRAGGQSGQSIWSGGQGLGFFCGGEMVAAISSGHMGSALLADDSEVTPTSAQDAQWLPGQVEKSHSPCGGCKALSH